MLDIAVLVQQTEQWVADAPAGVSRSFQTGCDSDGVWAAQFWQVPDDEDPISEYEIMEVSLSEVIARAKAYGAALKKWGQ